RLSFALLHAEGLPRNTARKDAEPSRAPAPDGAIEPPAQSFAVPPKPAAPPPDLTPNPASSLATSPEPAPQPAAPAITSTQIAFVPSSCDQPPRARLETSASAPGEAEIPPLISKNRGRARFRSPPRPS